MRDELEAAGREGPLRVLVAEDETIVRLDLRGLLERHGLGSAARPATARKRCGSRASSTPTWRSSTCACPSSTGSRRRGG